jgi:hypothetical protein
MEFPKKYERPMIPVNLSMKKNARLHHPLGDKYSRCNLNLLHINNKDVLLKEDLKIKIPSGTVVEHIQNTTPKCNFVGIKSDHNIQYKYTYYYVTDQIYDANHLPRPTAVETNTHIIPNGTIIIPQYGPDTEQVLIKDTAVILSSWCPVQILSGTLLQSYDHPENYIITTDPLDVYICDRNVINEWCWVCYLRQTMSNLFGMIYNPVSRVINIFANFYFSPIQLTTKN